MLEVERLTVAYAGLMALSEGDTSEKAKDAALRVVSQYPDLVAGDGAWPNSFTLAVTEATEPAHLPRLTLSYPRRDHRLRFPLRPPEFAPGNEQAQQTLAAAIVRGGDPCDGYDDRAGEVFSRRAAQIRCQRPPRWCAADPVQWQNGEPVRVAPQQFAIAKAIWTKQPSE